MNIGSARVSTGEQILDLQLDALAKAGCDKVFIGTAGGALVERESLRQALAYARAGDTLVVVSESGGLQTVVPASGDRFDFDSIDQLREMVYRHLLATVRRLRAAADAP
jgi:hypothetical protein